MESQNKTNESVEVATIKVRSKISPRKLVDKMIVEDGDEEELAKDFAKNGGIIEESDSQQHLIGVNTGKFYLNEKYIEQI